MLHLQVKGITRSIIATKTQFINPLPLSPPPNVLRPRLNTIHSARQGRPYPLPWLRWCQIYCRTVESVVQSSMVILHPTTWDEHRIRSTRWGITMTSSLDYCSTVYFHFISYNHTTLTTVLALSNPSHYVDDKISGAWSEHFLRYVLPYWCRYCTCGS